MPATWLTAPSTARRAITWARPRPTTRSSSISACPRWTASRCWKTRVVSRTELVEHLYDQDFDRDSNTIEVFVGRIRKKLGVDVIQTVRGLGYLLTPPSDAR